MVLFEKAQYPALEEANYPLAPEQLLVLKRQLDSEGKDPSPQSQFNYAWGLIKCNSSQQQRQGLNILSKLYKDEPSMRRECLYYLALGSYKAGEYSNARRFAETLLQSEPQNEQAQALKQLIDDKVTQEGLIGLGIAGGVLALGVGLIGALAQRRRR